MWIIWDAICLSHYTFNRILISLVVILDCPSLQYFLLFRNTDNNFLLQQPEKMILAKSTHRWRSPSVSESCSVVSTLRPHGLYSPWNSLGQNTGVGSLPFSRGSSRSRDRTQISRIAGRFFTSWAMREARPWHLVKCCQVSWKIKFYRNGFSQLLVRVIITSV